MSETKEIVKFDPNRYLILKSDPKKVERVIQRNLKGKRLRLSDLPRARVPSGGGARWKMTPAMGDDPKELRGVILDISDRKEFWIVPFDQSGGGSPPDCISMDGLEGFGNRDLPSDKGDGPHDCLTCVHGQWGSDPKGGRGRRCKDVSSVILLTEASVLPTVIVAPPTSLRKVGSFNMALSGQLKELSEVEVRLTLVAAKNKDGIEYSEIEISVIDSISPEIAERIDRMWQMMESSSQASNGQASEEPSS